MKKILSSIFNDATSAERRAVTIISIVLLLAITLPYVWASLLSPQGFSYSGLLFSPDDQNVHLMWARQASEGHLFFRDLFTTENFGAQPLFTNLFALLIGAVSAITRLPLIVVYHALRVLAALALLLGFYRLCALLTRDASTRILALFFAALGGGAGWLRTFSPVRALFPNYTFIDRPDGSMMMPEAFTFTSLLVFSLFAVSMALLVFIYLNTLRARHMGETKPAVVAALCAFLLANVHTYDAIPLNLTMLAWAAYSYFTRRRAVSLGDEAAPQRAGAMRVLAPLWVIAGTLPPLFYQLYVFRSSAEFQLKAVTPTLMPPFPDLALSYGLLFPLSLLALGFASRDAAFRRCIAPMALWAGITLVSIYLPGKYFPFARRMIEGLHLPLCFLAACGLIAMLRRVNITSSMRKIIALGVAALMSISSLQFALWTLSNAESNNLWNGTPNDATEIREAAFMPPLYLAPGDKAALRYLNESKADRDRAVLTLPPLGNYVPRETGRTTYIGHWAETLNFWNEQTRTGKLADAQRFYGGRMSESEARAFLRANKIGYVIVGFYEKRRGFSLPISLPLVPEGTSGDTQLYRVPR